jgi:glycosyltransferase involved in cell wall biosynthesis
LVGSLKIKYFMFGGQNSTDGVSKKLASQVSELSRQGVSIELVMVSFGEAHYPTNDFLTPYRVDSVPVNDFLGRIKRARKISKIFGETIDSLGPDDILYYRYSGAFPLYYPNKYLRGFRTCRIVTEHQTKELDEFKLNNNALTYWSERLCGKLLRKQSDAIIGVTDEITQYEITRAGDLKKPHLTIGNGFAVQSVPLRQAPHYNSDFHLLCVANVSRWHGLDRLLQGLAAYAETPKVVLHIAGDGAELPHLQKLTEELGITDRVVFHGFTTGKALDTLFDQCHIAVGSLGIHRKGLTQTSELKGREYCARGIPYILACADPDFPADFPHILHLPADESPININQVLAFTQEVCADPDHPQKMRRYAEEHLDWSVKMAKLKEFLEALVGEGAGIPEPGPASPGDDGPEVPKGATLPGPIATRVPGKGE